MGEVIFIAILLVGLVGWTFLLRRKARIFWLITMSIIGAIVATMEIVAKVTHDVTISQMYWRWSVNNVMLSHVAMLMLVSGIIALAVHLQWKVWTDRDYKNGEEVE